MTPDAFIDLCRQGLVIAALVAAPVLVAGLAAGLIMGVIQAATQIQESSLSFLPKAAAMAAALALCGPWMLAQLSQFTTTVIAGMAAVR